jgi:hypothetical protein
MRDLEIRKQLRRRLECEFGHDPDALILDELGVCCGEVRADMAVVNGELKGFEIKSDQDTLSRLPSQASVYSRVFDTISIVVAARHLAMATKCVPSWWGVLVAHISENSEPSLTVHRAEKTNPSPDPLAVAQLIWRDEALDVLTRYKLQSGLGNKSRSVLWSVLVRNLPLAELQMVVRAKLKSRRDWRSGV